jgi:NAD+ diphosphatase
VNAVEWGIAFSEDLVLLREVDGGARLPELYELHEDLAAIQLLPEAVPALISGPEGQIAKSFSLADGFVAPPGYRLEGLRSAFHGLTSAEFVAAGAARQKVEWYRTHRYCSRCGASNDRHTRLEAMVCTKCGQLHFARLSPAVIVLIQRGQEILLGRSPHFKDGVYSTLAGFVEPGETLEQCVHREIYEEVGVRVTNLRYFGSQPHPFPSSLMVGFVADWISGEIRIDPVELEDARWFTSTDLPDLPHSMSIARELIEDFLRRGTR